MINPILPAETEHIGQQIESATADKLMGILSGLRNGPGQDGAFSLVATLAKKRPEIAVALLLNKDRPDLSRDVIHEPNIEQPGVFHPLVQFVQEEGSRHNTIRHPRTCSEGLPPTES